MSDAQRHGLKPSVQTQFALPDYLITARQRELEAKRRRLQVAEGAGGGMVWLGGALAIGALLFSSGGRLGAGALLLGVLIVVGGYWRMRRDPHAMSRAGLATTLLSTIVLGAVVVQLLDPGRDDLGGRAPETRSDEPTPTPDPAEQPESPDLLSVPMYRGGPSLDGQQPGPGPAARPVARWRVFTGGELYSSPVVVDSTVYIGTKGGFLLALDAGTGEERWRFDLGGYIVRGTPAVAEGTVFIQAGYALFAIDAGTGVERWRVPIRFGGAPSPIVSDGLVFAATQEGHLYAVERSSGVLRWQAKMKGLVSGSPAVADGRVVLGDDGGTVTAFTVASGTVDWTANVEGEVFASVAIADEGVFVATTAPTLTRLDASTGEDAWRAVIGGQGSPAVRGASVFLGSGSNGLYALDAGTGEPRWLMPTGQPVVSSPAAAAELVYVGSGSTVYAVAADTGEPRWSFPTGGRITGSPAVTGTVLYVGSHDGFVYAIEEGREQ